MSKLFGFDKTGSNSKQFFFNFCAKIFSHKKHCHFMSIAFIITFNSCCRTLNTRHVHAHDRLQAPVRRNSFENELR